MCTSFERRLSYPFYVREPHVICPPQPLLNFICFKIHFLSTPIIFQDILYILTSSKHISTKIKWKMAYHGFFRRKKLRKIRNKKRLSIVCAKNHNSSFYLPPYNNNHHILKTDFYFSCIHTKVLANVTTKLIKQKKMYKCV